MPERCSVYELSDAWMSKSALHDWKFFVGFYARIIMQLLQELQTYFLWVLCGGISSFSYHTVSPETTYNFWEINEINPRFSKWCSLKLLSLFTFWLREIKSAHIHLWSDTNIFVSMLVKLSSNWNCLTHCKSFLDSHRGVHPFTFQLCCVMISFLNLDSSAYHSKS